jgi:hypothetical protein
MMVLEPKVLDLGEVAYSSSVRMSANGPYEGREHDPLTRAYAFNAYAGSHLDCRDVCISGA